MSLTSTNIPPSILKTVHSEEESQKFLGEWVAADNAKDEDVKEDEIRLECRKIKDARAAEDKTVTVPRLETPLF